MGISDSRVFVPGTDHHETAAKYKLSQKQAFKIYKVFKIGDKDGSNNIDVAEFSTIFKAQKSEYLTHLFTFMDIDQSGSLEFPDFLALVSSFCLMAEEEMTRFCFMAFDKDDDGVLNNEEMQHLEAVMKKGNATQADKYLKQFDADGDGLLNLQEFEELNLRVPYLLWPAFRLQFKVQEATLGSKVWNVHSMFLKGMVKKSPRYCCTNCLCLPERKLFPLSAEQTECLWAGPEVHLIPVHDEEDDDEYKQRLPQPNTGHIKNNLPGIVNLAKKASGIQKTEQKTEQENENKKLEGVQEETPEGGPEGDDGGLAKTARLTKQRTLVNFRKKELTMNEASHKIKAVVVQRTKSATAQKPGAAQQGRGAVQPTRPQAREKHKIGTRPSSGRPRLSAEELASRSTRLGPLNSPPKPAKTGSVLRTQKISKWGSVGKAVPPQRAKYEIPSSSEEEDSPDSSYPSASSVDSQSDPGGDGGEVAVYTIRP